MQSLALEPKIENKKGRKKLNFKRVTKLLVHKTLQEENTETPVANLGNS